MLFDVIKFELKYRLNRPATYIYFFIIFLLAFLAVCWSDLRFGGEIGKIKQNSSYVLFNIAAIFSLLPGIFITSAIMGVPVLRDFEHKMESLIFSTNITKTSYLFGRFIGSFIILTLITTGFIWGTWLGCHMPWIDHSKYLAAPLGQYAKPWLMIFSNSLISSCLFFAGGALSRKMLVVYLQAIVLLAFYILVTSIIGDVENLYKAALLDPFGIYTLQALTRYWTVSEKNALIVPFSGLLMANRLIWLAVALASLAVTFFFFKFRTIYTGLFRRRFVRKDELLVYAQEPLKLVKPVYTATSWPGEVRVLTHVYFQEIIRSVPFIGIALVGFVLIAIDAQYATSFYGTQLYPLSSSIAEFIVGEISLIISIMVLFYTGEMIWKERQIGFDQIYDTLPISSAVPVLSKYLALAGVVLLYILIMIPVGAIIQLAKGFTFIELGVYFRILMLEVFIPVLIYLAMAMFIQTVSANKFIGYALGVLVYIYIIFSGNMKIFYKLFIPNSGGLGTYSDMNGFAVDIQKFWVLKLYWAGFALLLLVIAVLLYQRGTDSGLRRRVSQVRLRYRGLPRLVSIVGLLMVLGAGVYYYMNVNVWNRYLNPQRAGDLQARYEKELKHLYGSALQPSVVNIKGSIDLVPEKGNMSLSVAATVKNLFNRPISKLLLLEPNDDDLKFSQISFSAPAKLVKVYPDYRFKVYQLGQPLKPGDSMVITLKGDRVSKGFKNGDANTSYVENGTFINNGDFLPFLGYSKDAELGDTEDRKKRGLAEQKGLPARSDSLARQVNLFEQRGRTHLDLTISTAPDQTALSPGYLVRKWKANGRAYFEYRMDKPIFDFFTIISGRYKVRHEKANNIALSVYYHKDHPFDVGTMFTSLHDGLGYDSTRFSPFQYRQMRIIEFPKYRGFAQSFPNTVPFSEGIGFVFRHEPEKLDMAYYVTAHELGHQWWGHQVCEAHTVGSAMFSESLAQYSAIMLLKKKIPLEELRRYLKYELDRYLRGRSAERKVENPLDQTDNQDYIHYQKGTLAFFAMQDYIGEDHMNRALRKLIANYANGDKYPTSDVLTGYIKEETPDSLKFVVDDLYSKITLFDNMVVNPSSKKIDGIWEVTIPVQTLKYYADRSGNEKRTPIKDYIDIGVFSMIKGKDKLVYLKREHFTKDHSTFVVRVKTKPSRAGIDPVYKLVDRNTDDNTAAID